jgi:DNA-binding CsgD family transcriptional regulator
VRALAELAAGRTSAAAGEVEEARHHLDAGLAVLTDLGWPLIAADLHLELALLLQPDDRAAAVAEARAALAIYTSVGAARMHDAQAVLHALGAGTVRTEPAVVAKLTPRERQVLRLLADGASNPDIARALVISAKTAEHHVSNILRKLQLQGRSEAAVYAATLAAPERTS